MIAGIDGNEIDEIKSVIREICPDMGFCGEDKAMPTSFVVTGNGISRLIEVLQVLSRIELVETVNKYGTRGIVKIAEKQESRLEREGEMLCATA